MNNQPVHVALAILYQNEKFLCQLRDNIPGILYPDHWGLFGGHLEPGETPEIAMKRELLEEIGYIPPNLSEFSVYADETVVRHIYHAPLTVAMNQLVLNEGFDMGLLTPEEINAGKCYSAKRGDARPLGTPHQKILQDFLEFKK